MMDEWELLNTEDGLALQDAMYAPVSYQLHNKIELPHNDETNCTGPVDRGSNGT